MRVSFIITSYNIASYIGQCLSSVAASIESGDQVIIVDDGSRDETISVIKQSLSGGVWPADVEFLPIFLGSNSHGGVGIAANIGLRHATGEAVFFVDGDDWLHPQGVRDARAAFVKGEHDILLANYEVFDEAQGCAFSPSDAQFWPEKSELPTGNAARDLALRLNSVPWRKFYRQAWLQKHGLRFPEGDFFYEDNPFHWACCLRARSIGFVDVCVASHRLNRPGQTMSDGGAGFSAIFTHYETIEADVKKTAPSRLPSVDLWLVTNMAWQLERISMEALPAYAMRADAVLSTKRRKRFTRSCEGSLESSIGYLISALLQGGAVGLVQAWGSLHMNRKLEQTLARVEQRLLRLEQTFGAEHNLLQETRDYALQARNQLAFHALEDGLDRDRPTRKQTAVERNRSR